MITRQDITKVVEEELERLDVLESGRKWDVQANGFFRCRLCGKLRDNSLRSSRTGFCKLCMGE